MLMWKESKMDNLPVKEIEAQGRKAMAERKKGESYKKVVSVETKQKDFVSESKKKGVY